MATYCFTTRFLEEQPETAEKITRAWFRAIEFIRTNPDEAAATIPIYTNIEPSLAKKLNQPAQQKSTEVDREAVQKVADLYQSFGIISKPIDTSGMFFVPSN